MFPSEIRVKEFPSSGGASLLPVVQVIYDELEETIVHSMPSIRTESEEPKFAPVIRIFSSPNDDPKEGATAATVAVSEPE